MPWAKDGMGGSARITKFFAMGGSAGITRFYAMEEQQLGRQRGNC